MAKLFSSLLFQNSLRQAVRNNSFTRTFHCSALNMIKYLVTDGMLEHRAEYLIGVALLKNPRLLFQKPVGEAIPPVELYEGMPGNAVNIADFCKDKKVILFGLPGAFTPGCSRTHLPGYVERYSDFKKNGIDEVVCVSVNDVFVLEAWAKDQNATGKIRMFADPNATFTKTVGLDLEIPPLGGTRSKRYVMIIDNGIIQTLKVEQDGTGLSCSLASKIHF